MKKILVISIVMLALFCSVAVAYDGAKNAKYAQSIFLNDQKLQKVLRADPPPGSNLAALCLEVGNEIAPRYGDPEIFAQKLGVDPHPDFLKYGYGVPIYNWHNYSRGLSADQIRGVLLAVSIGLAIAEGDDSDKNVSSKLLYLVSKLGEGNLGGNFFLEVQNNLGVKGDLAKAFYASLLNGNKELFDLIVESSLESLDDVKIKIAQLKF